MKYENTILHVFEDGIKEEFQIQFSYDSETGKILPISWKGRFFILHGISIPEIINTAIMQNEYVASIDGEKYTDHIYFDINDYALIKGLENNHFKNELNYEPKKSLLKK